ncbi:MAG: prepilin peptidase [bacterium]
METVAPSFQRFVRGDGFFFSFSKLWLQNGTGPQDPFQALTGYVFAGTFFILVRGFYPKGIGGGDVVMAAALGAWLGAERVWVVIFLAFGLGAFCSALMILTGRLKRKSFIPFGPYLALSALVVWFFPEIFNSLKDRFF